MQFLTGLLGFTAIWTVAVAFSPACNRAKLAQCRKKPKIQEVNRKMKAFDRQDLTQITPQDAKQMCKAYATFLGCMGGAENLKECSPNGVGGVFEVSEIEDVCNDEDRLKGWVCVMQQIKDGYQGLDSTGATCEEAKEIKSKNVASLTEKCGAKIRGDIERFLDQAIEKRFCA